MDRRTLIKGLAALAPLVGSRRLLAETPKGGATRTCRLITQDIAGPYRTANVPVRSDISGGQAGTPLELNFEVIDSFGCQPMAGARVSIWHCNADGLYSDVNNVMLGDDISASGGFVSTKGETFLRGTQITDAEGRVQFQTIYPGWYYPRATHMHVMIFPPDFGEVATTQLYFPDEVCDQAYQAEAYAHRGPNPMRTDPSADSTIDGSDAQDLWVDLRSGANGYSLNHRFGVTFYGDSFGELPDYYRQS